MDYTFKAFKKAAYKHYHRTTVDNLGRLTNNRSANIIHKRGKCYFIFLG